MNISKHILSVFILAVIICSPLAYTKETADKPFYQHATPAAEPLAKSNAVMYAEITKNVTPIKTYLRQEQGYNIESGRYRDKKGNIGSIIIVSARDGAATVIYDLPEKHEILTISSRGKHHVIPTKPAPMLNVDDTMVDKQAVPADKHAEITSLAGEQNIEFLVAYSTYALRALGDIDPIAYALAQLETAVEGLNNSKISGVRLSLGAVGIFNTGVNYDTSNSGLNAWQSLLNPYRRLYQTDMNMAITDVREGNVVGRAYLPGYTSVNYWSSPTVFRHELGHNVGGDHCNVNGTDDYKFGYDNGRSKTFLCWNSSPYYSTPNVKDDYGLPVGNAVTADMARLWREQASRMANYNTELPGEKLIFIGLGVHKTGMLTINTSNANPVAGFVALSPAIGPTVLAATPGGGFTQLNVPLKNRQGVEHSVTFRAQRRIGGCSLHPMNSITGCTGGGSLSLYLRYYPEDNDTLPKESYNGLLILHAKDNSDTTFNVPVNIPIAIDNTR